MLNVKKTSLTTVLTQKQMRFIAVYLKILKQDFLKVSCLNSSVLFKTIFNQANSDFQSSGNTFPIKNIYCEESIALSVLMLVYSKNTVEHVPAAWHCITLESVINGFVYGSKGAHLKGSDDEQGETIKRFLAINLLVVPTVWQ